jgi:DNA-binding NarL/FixJ family response regulator
MDIVETPRDAAFTVVGINAAVIVPVPPASVEASLAFIRIGNEVFTALQAALAEGWVLQLARDRAALTQGEAPCDEQPAPALRSIPSSPDFGARAQRVHAALTEREREVLCLVAGGATNRAIASRLFISPKTASVHVSRILTKLDATTRTEAAALAHASGLVLPPDMVGPHAVNA